MDSSVTIPVKDVEAVTLSQWQTSQSLLDMAKTMAASYQSLVNAQNKVIDALSTTVENYTREIARYIEEVEEYRRKAKRYEEDCAKRLDETKRFGSPRTAAPQIPAPPPVPSTLADAVQNGPEANELAATVDRSTKKVNADAKKTISTMADVHGNQLLLELKQGFKLKPMTERKLASQPVRPKGYKSPVKADPLAALKAKRAEAAASKPIVVAVVTSPKKIAADLAMPLDNPATSVRVGQEISKSFKDAQQSEKDDEEDDESDESDESEKEDSSEEEDEVAEKSGSEAFFEESKMRKKRATEAQRRGIEDKRYGLNANTSTLPYTGLAPRVDTRVKWNNL